MKMFVISDAAELAKHRTRDERVQKNWRWFHEHLRELGETHRGKSICVAGEELFSADSPEEAIALAKVAHPKDDGLLVHYIPREKRIRIYASRSNGPVAGQEW